MLIYYKQLIIERKIYMNNISDNVIEFMSIENQHSLRDRLNKIIDDRGFTVSKVARLLDIIPHTLRTFLNPKKSKARVDTLLKIDKFVTEYENIRRV
jgi:predicted transcriptional regulator